MSPYKWERWDHHPECPGGCGQLADECACPQPGALGSLRIHAPEDPSKLHLLEERSGS